MEEDSSGDDNGGWRGGWISMTMILILRRLGGEDDRDSDETTGHDMKTRAAVMTTAPAS